MVTSQVSTDATNADYCTFCTYLELLDYSGAVQTGLRALFGWHDARSYWFPDIRSVGGAIFVMSAVLYP